MRAVHAVVCVWMTACALLTDLGTLSSPADATGDAPSDASPVDAGDSSSASPCASVHTFCDDFDGDGGLGATWDGVQQGSGPLALSTTNVVTAPHALQATGNVSGNTSLYKNFPAADHTRIEFDLMITSPASTSGTEIDFITIELLQPPSPWGYGDLGFSRSGGTSVLEQYLSPTDGGVASFHDLAVNEAFAAWRHVVLDLTFSAQKLDVTIDGKLVQTMSFSPLLDLSPLQISIGAPFVANTTGDWNVFVDDFVVDQN